MSRTVAVAFVPAPADQSPNIRAYADVSTAYYRAIVVTLASVRRWNPGADLVLVTDTQPDHQFLTQFEELSVRLQFVPFRHSPPAGFWPTFNASLYTLDAMAALSASGRPGDQCLLIDPDVLCLGDLSLAFRQIEGSSILCFPTGFPDDERSQGLSAVDVEPMHQALDPVLLGPPVHYGGELYGFTAEGAAPVLERAEAAWNFALESWSIGEVHFVTEEHLLNYALRRSPIVTAERIIRRIWTAPVLRTVRGDEGELVLWHLPAEKDRAFVQLYAAASDPRSWFWVTTRDEFVRRSGSLAGIPRRTPRRWAYDSAARAARRLQRAARRGARR